MAEVAYYFNAYDEATWTNPDNIVDNNLETFGSTTSTGRTQVLTGNNCPGTDLGTILKVELRVFGYGDGNDKIGIRPFWQTYGGSYLEVMLTSPGWSAYFDITNDPYAPDWSSWSHVQETDCWIWRVAVGKGNPMYCAKVEIRVTYTPSAGYYHGLKVQGVGELALCDVGTNPLRIRKGGTTYGIELVETSDPNASPIRIKTGAGIKAIRKYTDGNGGPADPASL